MRKKLLAIPLILCTFIFIVCSCKNEQLISFDQQSIPGTPDKRLPSQTFTITRTPTFIHTTQDSEVNQRPHSPTVTTTVPWENPLASLENDLYMVYSVESIHGHSLFTTSINKSTVNQLFYSPYLAKYSSAISPSGRYLAYIKEREEDCGIISIDLPSGIQKIITPPHVRFISGISWSPDDRFVAYHAATKLDRDDTWSIYVYDSTTEETIRLTEWDTEELVPAWSPDGMWISFISQHYQTEIVMRPWGFDLFLMNTKCIINPVSCLERYRQLSFDGNMSGTSWLPDSKHLIFSCEGYSELCVIDIQTSQIDTFGLDIELQGRKEKPSVSPDGEWIAFTFYAENSLRSDLYLISASIPRVIINVTNTDEQSENFEFWLDTK